MHELTHFSSVFLEYLVYLLIGTMETNDQIDITKTWHTGHVICIEKPTVMYSNKVGDRLLA